MTEQEPSTFRPFVFSVVEDDGVNVTIEVSEGDYQSDLAAGIDEEDTMKPGRRYLKALTSWLIASATASWQTRRIPTSR